MQHPEHRWQAGLRASRRQEVVRLSRIGMELGGAPLWLARRARCVASLSVVIVLVGFSLYPYMA